MSESAAPVAEAVPGHNSAADAQTLEALMAGLPTVDQLIELLMAENQEALDRVAAIQEKGGEYFMIDSDEADAAATEFLVKVRARYKASEADRVGRKSPFDDLAGAVQAFYKTRILDPLGAAPSNAREEFDPTDSDQYGIGVRITMAQTLFKRRKAERERKAREAEAERLRKIEAEAAAKRAADKKAADDRAAAIAKAAKDKADAEAAERKAAADKAAKEAKEAEEAAARKRSASNKEAADKAAKEAADRAAKAKADQEAADRVAKAEQDERDRKAKAEQDERDRLALEEENRLAEARARAEESAAATTADLSRARGGKGGVSSLREFVDFRDLDRKKLAVPLNMKGEPAKGNDEDYPPSICLLLPFITDAAIEKAVKDFEKANKATVLAGIKNGKQPIYGVVYFLNSKAAGRA